MQLLSDQGLCEVLENLPPVTERQEQHMLLELDNELLGAELQILRRKLISAENSNAMLVSRVARLEESLAIAEQRW